MMEVGPSSSCLKVLVLIDVLCGILWVIVCYAGGVLCHWSAVDGGSVVSADSPDLPAAALTDRLEETCYLVSCSNFIHW